VCCWWTPTVQPEWKRDVPRAAFRQPAWVRLYLHALSTAKQLHLEVNLNIVSGWNLGGPDVTPAQASKLLTWSRTLWERARASTACYPCRRQERLLSTNCRARLSAATRRGPCGHDGRFAFADSSLKYKTASLETGISMRSRSPAGRRAATPGEQDTELDDVIDLSAQVDEAGRTTWHPPSAGTWEILRVGYTDSDVRVSTSSDTWQGWRSTISIVVHSILIGTHRCASA